MPPMSCTSKCRRPSVRRPASRTKRESRNHRRLERLGYSLFVVVLGGIGVAQPLLDFGL